MRRIFISLLVIGMFGATCAPETIDVEAEKAAIRQLIERRYNEYNNKDFDGWASTIVNGQNTHMYWATKSGYGERIGWDVIGSYFKKVMEDNPEPSPREHVFENFNYRIWKDTAFVTFDYYTEGNKEEDPDFIPTKNIYVFEKTEEGWKCSSWVNLRRNTWREIE